MKKIFHHLYWVLKGVQVFALVGRSGTGKSFRAKLVAEKYSIPLIIDDGILIRDEKIVAGKTAKQASGYLSAVKTAIFEDDKHRDNIIKALSREDFKRILLIGTSEKMIKKIIDRLELPHLHKLIKIEDIATQQEIERALHSRVWEQKHVIPVPAMEVGKTYSHILADSVRVFLNGSKRFFKKKRVFEKAVVRPDFHRKQGKVTISESALGQMILHCIDEFDDSIEINKMGIKSRNGIYVANLTLAVSYGGSLAGNLHKLQQYIIDSLYRYTGVLLEEVHINVDNIRGGSK